VITAAGLLAGVGALALVVTLAMRIDPGNVLTGPAAGTGVTRVVAQDGSADFATIGAALAAAGDGDTILVRPGAYVEALEIEKDVTVRGDGPVGAVIIGIPPDAPTMRPEDVEATDAHVGIRMSSVDAALSNLSLAGEANAISVLVDGGSPTLSSLRVDVPPAVGDGSMGGVAFFLIGGTTATLTDSTWDGYLAVREGASPLIEGNVVGGDGHLSIDGPGETTMRGNTFEPGTGTSLSAMAQGLVEGNDLTNAAIAVDTGSDIVVRGNTLRDVIAGAGAIVVTGPGSTATVSGNTVSGSSIAISVADRARATIDGNTLTDNGTAVLATAAGVTVDGNTIRGGGSGVVISGGSVTANTIEGNRTAISIVGQGDVAIIGNTLCENEVNVRPYGDTLVPLDGNEVCPETASGAPTR
jgi:parallel beta-helix repeat protein